MAWMVVVVGLLVLACGIVVGRLTSAAAKRVGELEVELERARQDSARYRAQVNQHFVKTAELLGVMTASYRSVYEHLADGAKALCSEEVVELSPAALRSRLLPPADEVRPIEQGRPAAPSAQVAFREPPAARATAATVAPIATGVAAATPVPGTAAPTSGTPRTDASASRLSLTQHDTGIHLTKEDLLLASLSSRTASPAPQAAAEPKPAAAQVAESTSPSGADHPPLGGSNHLGPLSHGNHHGGNGAR
jgi:uncharacterized membrane-anchored protein YhcB (DUF1043 family)